MKKRKILMKFNRLMFIMMKQNNNEVKMDK